LERGFFRNEEQFGRIFYDFFSTLYTAFLLCGVAIKKKLDIFQQCRYTDTVLFTGGTAAAQPLGQPGTGNAEAAPSYSQLLPMSKAANAVFFAPYP